MFLIFLPFFIFYRFYLFFVFRAFELFGFFKNLAGVSRDWEITVNVDENIGTYWACLPGMLQKRWFTQETRFRESMKMSNLSDSAYEKLKTI